MIVKPHGGELIDRVLSAKEREAILSFADKFFSLEIDEEKAIEVQNIATGVFSLPSDAASGHARVVAPLYIAYGRVSSNRPHGTSQKKGTLNR